MPFTRARDRKGVIAMVHDHASAVGLAGCAGLPRAPKMAGDDPLPNNSDQRGDRIIAHRFFSSRIRALQRVLGQHAPADDVNQLSWWWKQTTFSTMEDQLNASSIGKLTG